ncbi:MAG: sulfide/dihydroorotate dehydrogenase-like FAD/NAD-binding protein [Nanoarchaeota archaeon]|nr:sulfide/dihydroorotate dehydrogenase-like FAD/NAD-binding protein [Nanoarchaeota archaeon]
MYKILKKQKIGKNIYEMQIDAPHIVKYAKPGNFIILRKDDNGERIPFTIADLDKTTITIIFNVVGKTTADLAKLKKGNMLKDAVGPLGNPAEIGEFGSVCLIAGGTGCAASYILTKALKKKGNRITNIIGAKTKNHLIWEDKFKQISNTMIICTDDGSKGMKGTVTEALEKLIRNKYFNRVITIGPPAMMKEVARLTYQRCKTVAHLSPIMIDGIGICGGCRIKVAGKTKLVCIDGPEFDAHEIDFDVLQNRNTRFREEEKDSHHKSHGSCIKNAAKRMKAQETRKPQKAAKTKVIKKDAKKKKPIAKTRKTR